jgi:dTDP-4-dehydrorhamnose reductase
LEAHSTIAHIGISHEAPVLLLSTDAVFAGDSPWYPDTFEPNPHSNYGAAKRSAEEIVLSAPKSRVVRLPMIYGHSPKGARPTFVERTVSNLRAGKAMPLPTMQFVSPVHADDAARAVIAALFSNDAPPILHFSSTDKISRYHLALVAARAFDQRVELLRPDPVGIGIWADRPKYSLLTRSDFFDCNRIPIRTLSKGIKDLAYF